jgi:hypothetical protein
MIFRIAFTHQLKMKYKWLNQQVPQAHQAEFQMRTLQENVYLILLGAAIGAVTHLAYHWVDWQHYQQGLFEREPSYRWLFYSNAVWWLLYGIPVHFFRNWSRIKKGDYPLRQLQWRVDFVLVAYCLNILSRIACIAQTSVMQAFANYLVLLFIFSFFHLDYKRRILLIFSTALATGVIINTQTSSFTGEFVATIYCIIVAIFVFVFSNAWYHRIIKQFLVEKELKEQAEVLKQQNQLIEDQKVTIANELEVSRRQITATALVLARKQNTNELLKAEVSSLDETVPLSATAKNKFLKIIDQEANEEDEWANFQQQFELVEPFFLKNILKDFPVLTPSDLKLLILIRMNIDTKEFAGILRISAQSANTARYRLRKRLRLPEEVSLDNFVLTYVDGKLPGQKH